MLSRCLLCHFRKFVWSCMQRSDQMEISHIFLDSWWAVKKLAIIGDCAHWFSNCFWDAVSKRSDPKRTDGLADDYASHDWSARRRSVSGFGTSLCCALQLASACLATIIVSFNTIRGRKEWQVLNVERSGVRRPGHIIHAVGGSTAPSLRDISHHSCGPVNRAVVSWLFTEIKGHRKINKKKW